MTPAPSSEKRPVVWVVDDSALDAERARRVLEGQYAVRVFSDGSAMLEHLASHPPPDVLVLDWVMPGVSGIEVCRFLRSSHGVSPQLAVLLLTMQTQTEQIVEGLEAGANDYLVKPYADPELRARVDSLVRWIRLLERANKAEASVVELLEHAPDPLLRVDGEHRIAFANREAERVLGSSGEDLEGKSLSEVVPRLRVEQLSEAARLSRPLPDVEIGEQLFSPSVRFLPSEGEAGLTIALRDVTARRQRESRRLDFYSMIAHDLRSPLGAMLMRTDMMLRGRRGVLSAELIADLRKMETHMRGLVALINDFLEFARMEEAAHKMEWSRFDVAVLINEIVDDFRPLVDSTRQQLSIDAGEVNVLGDRRRLQQVLTNLISNAIKFTPEMGTIRTCIEPKVHELEVSVIDTGRGIPLERQTTLFDRYTRVTDSADSTPGTGLGLMIVREIVEAHGGSVGVESTPGQGSRFWFRLPKGTPAPEAP